MVTKTQKSQNRKKTQTSKFKDLLPGILAALAALIAIVVVIIAINTSPKAASDIAYFKYSYSALMGGDEYEIVSEDGVVNYSLTRYGADSQNIEKEIDPAFLNDLATIIEDYDLSDWDGFNERDTSVLDGYGFTLEIQYSDGKEITASGYMNYPDGYEDASAALKELLSSAE